MPRWKPPAGNLETTPQVSTLTASSQRPRVAPGSPKRQRVNTRVNCCSEAYDACSTSGHLLAHEGGNLAGGNLGTSQQAPTPATPAWDARLGVALIKGKDCRTRVDSGSNHPPAAGTRHMIARPRLARGGNLRGVETWEPAVGSHPLGASLGRRLR